MTDQICLFDTANESRWAIDIDNDRQMLRCESCGGRVIRKWYDLAVGDKGFKFCPYCGKQMTNAESMVVKWPGYREKASPKWLIINKGERGYSAGDFRCSECGKPNPCWSLTEYCPNCGEHMEEDI